MRFASLLTSLLLCLFAMACANEVDDEGDDPIVGDDDDDDTAVGDDDDDDQISASCDDVVPTSGFGTILGEYLPGFTLEECGAGVDAEFSLYGDSFCSVNEDGTLNRPKATFVAMAAGWCPPCRVETEALTNGGIAAEYEPRGVRFVQVVIHNNNPNRNTPADRAFCDGWVDQYNPSYPTLLNNPLVDVESNVLRGEALPFSVVLDQDGRIVKADEGFNEANLRATLDEVLADAED